MRKGDEVFQIERAFRFEAAHHLPAMPTGHKCARPHGHSYTARIELASAVLDEYGMVTDFANLAPFGNYLAATFDHQDLNTVPDGSGGLLLPQPTSEWLARHLFNVASKVLPGPVAAMVTAVTVCETPRTSATYRPDPGPPAFGA